MKMKKVYVTGPYESRNHAVVTKHRTDLELICRRVIVAKMIPICPTLFYVDFLKDPRLPKDIKWWIDNIFLVLMRDCSVFCYIPDLAGTLCERMQYEKEKWRELGRNKFVVAERVLNVLLNYNMEEEDV